jgi:hypothetical protein
MEKRIQSGIGIELNEKEIDKKIRKGNYETKQTETTLKCRKTDIRHQDGNTMAKACRNNRAD